MTKPQMVRVLPSPSLPSNHYVPGVGADGAELPEEEAKRMVTAGLVVIAKSDEKPKESK